MNKLTFSSISLPALAIASALLSSAASVEAATIATQETVVVLRVGDGTTALSANAASVFLEEYAINFNGAGVPTSATHVQTIPIDNPQINPPDPATIFGTGLTIGGNASLEGGLNFSTNGQYLMFGGHHAEVSDCATGDNRCNPSGKRKIIGRVDLAGLDTYDAIYGAGTTSANNGMRTVTSVDGNQYWFGQSASPGIAYRTWEGPPGDDGDDPAVTATSLNTQNTRRLEIHNSQLYVSAAATGIFGVATVGGPGPPNTTGQTVTILPGMPTTTGPSPVDFWFADANTLYVADDRTFNSTTSTGSTSGGLQKWTFDGTNWNLVYTKNIDTTNETIDYGLRGLTGSVGIDGTVTLFGTTTFGTAGTANYLIGVSDTLANTNAASVIVTTLAHSASIPTMTGSLATFRGLEDIGVFIPEPTSLALLAIGGMLLLSGRRR